MILYKYHSKSGTVKAVEGEPWPGTDADGDTCFVNSHFATEGEAWDAMVRDVSAGVSIAARIVEQVREELRQAETKAATAAIEFARVMANKKAKGL